MNKAVVISILLSLFFLSCIKELDGPNTLAPVDPVATGHLAVYTSLNQDDIDFCAGIKVSLDGISIGTLSQRVSSVTNCKEDFGVIYLDSVVEGDHILSTDPCDTLQWSIPFKMVKDACQIIRLSPQ